MVCYSAVSGVSLRAGCVDGRDLCGGGRGRPRLHPRPLSQLRADHRSSCMYTSVVYTVCMRLESASISAVDPDPHSFSLLDPEPRWKD